MENWKTELLKVGVVTALVGGYYVYTVNEKTEAEDARKLKAMFQAEDEKAAALRVRLDAVCYPAAERLLQSRYDSRIVDHGGSSVRQTSTGWRLNLSATVARKSQRFFGICFVDQDYRLLDFQHSFE